MGANFRSDNEAPVAPEIMAALSEANRGTAHAYGEDVITARLKDMFRDLFQTDVSVFPLISGTAANALAVAQTTPPFGAVICHQDSHMHTDECGAPEFYTGGAKLLALPGEDGKLEAGAVCWKIANAGHAGDHASKPTLLSITQATEFGTVYSLEEIRDLAAVAHEAGMHVHMDGARFANALCCLGCSPAAMTWQAGVDMVSFGATKNGAMMAEALLVFDDADAEQLGRRRKQAGHLLSKMRYVSAQLEAYLADDLWLRLAAHANRMARRMVEGLEEVAGIELLYPVQSNEIFVRMDADLAEGLGEAGFQLYGWPGRPAVYRLVTSHCTEEEEVESFLAAVRSLSPG
ncbi:MAG: threonine aldolase [Gammaproteobacteria bacterium SG8_31]|jgi:threonine aldolase|nr:MAG: threonine aldolase [Gammaproteobacteria bacterium SG8_31]